MAIFFVFLLTTVTVSGQEHWSPEQVFYGKGGKLAYTPDEKGNTIPDFSHVGYKYGDEAIPDVATVVEVSPVEGDDGAVIQDAINSLYSLSPDKNGFRGAVLLKAGEYQVAGQIKIRKSGIILRGEGDTENGTVIIAEGTSDRDLIQVDNDSRRSVISSSRKSLVEDYVPVGRKYVVISNNSEYEVGDDIVLYRPGTSKWISDIKMNQITPSDGTVQWSSSSYSFYFERKITKISGDTLFFRNPVVMAMEKMYGGGAVYKYTFNRLQNVGVEDLCLKSAYKSELDENHSWNAIKFSNIENGWVRNVTSWYFAYACVNLERNSKFITVDNCHCREPKSVITGGRRYSFNLAGSLNLIKNCSTTEGRHDYVTSSRVCGPSVFTRCTATNVHADIGPHHRWAMGTLYDIIETDGAINVQDRDDMGTGHGWAGANQVFWNCKGESSICQSPWASAKNYNFGFMGAKNSGARPNRPDGVWVGHNVPGIFPVSLYEAQMNNRMTDSTIFAVLPKLVQVNDSSYNMEFSLPFNISDIATTNFQVSEPEELKDAKIEITVMDDYTVNITSVDFINLPNSVLKIKSENITSAEGKRMQGNTAASFKVEKELPVLPVVNGLSKIIDNIDGFAEASSSLLGYIYFVKYGENFTTQAELDSVVTSNNGRKVEVSTPDSLIQIFTKGLPGGYYQYYAVDSTGLVSLPSSTWVIVDENGPVSTIIKEINEKSFLAYFSNDRLVIDPQKNEDYMLEIFNVNGKLLYKNKHLSGRQSIDLLGNSGVMIIRKSTDTKIEILKIVSP